MYVNACVMVKVLCARRLRNAGCNPACADGISLREEDRKHTRNVTLRRALITRHANLCICGAILCLDVQLFLRPPSVRISSTCPLSKGILRKNVRSWELRPSGQFLSYRRFGTIVGKELPLLAE